MNFSINKFYDEYVGSEAWHVKDETGVIHAITWNENLAFKIMRLLIEGDT